MNINLREYFLSNCKSNDFYFRFYNYIKEFKIVYGLFDTEEEPPNIIIFDAQECIRKFKKLLEPNLNSSTAEYEFILYCFFLFKNGYFIEQFPNILKQPESLNSFSNTDMRMYLIQKGRGDSNRVAYAERRLLANELIFTKIESITVNNFEISDEINNIFQSISTRDAYFQQMTVDEKLESINNAIEFIIGRDSRRYEEFLSSAILLGLINDNQLRKLRNMLHAFRHGSKEMVLERNNYTEKQKTFLINYGISVLIAAYEWDKDVDK